MVWTLHGQWRHTNIYHKVLGVLVVYCGQLLNVFTAPTHTVGGAAQCQLARVQATAHMLGTSQQAGEMEKDDSLRPCLLSYTYMYKHV